MLFELKIPVVFETCHNRPEYENVRKIGKYSQRQKFKLSDTSRQCYNYGENFVPGHKASCPAKGRKCYKCGNYDHLSKVCLSENDLENTQTPKQTHTFRHTKKNLRKTTMTTRLVTKILNEGTIEQYIKYIQRARAHQKKNFKRNNSETSQKKQFYLWDKHYLYVTHLCGQISRRRDEQTFFVE